MAYHRRKNKKRYFRDVEYEDVKSWSLHDLAEIRPLTTAQEEMFQSFYDGQHLVAYGSAGTGKTFIALYLALTSLLHSKAKINNITIVRSAVQSRDIGFTPGTLEEKQSIYENPYRDIFWELIGHGSTYDDMKKQGLVTFTTSSVVRGLTWANSIIIIDEIQNFSFGEIHSCMTRVGDHSRVIALGDTAQNDLLRKKNEESGMEKFLKVMKKVGNTKIVQFTRDDIVRSGFCKAWIIAMEEIE